MDKLKKVLKRVPGALLCALPLVLYALLQLKTGRYMWRNYQYDMVTPFDCAAVGVIIGAMYLLVPLFWTEGYERLEAARRKRLRRSAEFMKDFFPVAVLEKFAIRKRTRRSDKHAK